MINKTSFTNTNITGDSIDLRYDSKHIKLLPCIKNNDKTDRKYLKESRKDFWTFFIKGSPEKSAEFIGKFKEFPLRKKLVFLEIMSRDKSFQIIADSLLLSATAVRLIVNFKNSLVPEIMAPWLFQEEIHELKLQDLSKLLLLFRVSGTKEDSYFAVEAISEFLKKTLGNNNNNLLDSELTTGTFGKQSNATDQLLAPALELVYPTAISNLYYQVSKFEVVTILNRYTLIRFSRFS